jgi:prepilin-type processing-associated H-X9-DG protein
MANIPRPAEAYYVVCGMNAGGGWWRGINYSRGSCTTVGSYVRRVHNEGINIACADGHAKWYTTERAFANTSDWYVQYLPWQPNQNAYPPGW